jgi:hypothetical protein
MNTCLGACGRWVDTAPYDQAVILARNSLHGRPPAGSSRESMFARRIYHHGVYRALYTLAAVGCMLLAFWEPPTQPTRPSWPALRALDACALVLFTADSALQYVYFGRALFIEKRCVARGEMRAGWGASRVTRPSTRPRAGGRSSRRSSSP